MTSPSSNRRLAAVVFTDIVGYSAIVHDDEVLGEKLLNRQRAVVRRIVPVHQGREIETAGDSFLLEFDSAYAAVQAVLDIQQALAAENADQPAHNRVVLRASVHLGDVEHRDGDLYGDGVNIAARLLPHSPEGGMALSASVLGLIRQRMKLPLRSIGSPPLKNIAHPVEIFVLDHASPEAAAPTEQKAGAAVAPRLSICVLPFTNISGDPEQEYFSDGISEDIITDLSKVSALSVVSRNTSFTYKGKAANVAEVGRQLNIGHVLEGSVRKAGNRVRITAQLIRTSDDSHLWAERYDRDLKDIFALQDEISKAIVTALRLTLMPAEKKAIETHSTTNAEAYKLYLMARQYRNTGNSRHYPVIIRLCKQALKIDPNYARAWALLAIGLGLRDVYGDVDSGELRQTVVRALELDPKLADAHAAHARQLLGEGRLEECKAAVERALALDPDSYDVHASAARYFIAAKNQDQAIHHLEIAVKLVETDIWAPGMLMMCHRARGDMAGVQAAARLALERVEKAVAAEPDHGTAMAFGVQAMTHLGQRDRALEWAERAMLMDPDNRNLQYNMACSMIGMDKFDRALELLEQVIGITGRRTLEWAKVDTDLDPIRADPRFVALMARAEARIAAVAREAQGQPTSTFQANG